MGRGADVGYGGGRRLLWGWGGIHVCAHVVCTTLVWQRALMLFDSWHNQQSLTKIENQPKENQGSFFFRLCASSTELVGACRMMHLHDLRHLTSSIEMWDLNFASSDFADFNN